MKTQLHGLSILLLSFLASCSLQDGEPNSMSSAAKDAPPTLAGRVTGVPGKGRIYAVLYDLSAKQPRPLADQLLTTDSRFEFLSPPRGAYGVAVFRDANGNLRQDVGEYAGYTRFPAIAATASGRPKSVATRNITLRRRSNKIHNPVVISPQVGRALARAEAEQKRKALAQKKPSAKPAPKKLATPGPTRPSAKQPPRVATKKPAPPRHPQSGSVVSLSDARFSQQAAAGGYADPHAFVQQHGTGLYLTDPYRARRRPVIFIHGVGGSSQDWRRIFSSLDLRTVQPMFYHYPTGLGIERASSTLVDLVAAVSKRYRLGKPRIVGHGTGGLIGRRLAQSIPNAGLITLGTPWDGVPVASSQVKRSHASWDIRRGSPSLRTVRRGRLANHQLLFAYQNPATISSQLEPNIQSQAARVYGFNSNERGLLTNPQVASQVSQALR